MENKRQLSRQNSFLSNLFKIRSEKEDLFELLHTIPPFAELSNKEIEQLYHIMHDRVYAPHEYIFYQSDPGIAFYIIQEGEVEVLTTNEEARIHRIAYYKKGDFFGEMALLDDARRFASAIALKESKLLVIFKPDLDEYIEKFPKKGIKILKGISQIFALRLRQLNQNYSKLFFETSKEQETANGTAD
ncbi:MAG: cyclic nucleotide-binding domain-containing protein [Ignavibacteria bacterium]